MRTSGETVRAVRALAELSQTPVGRVGRCHFVPLGLSGEPDAIAEYLDRLNAALLVRLQQVGRAFLYEAVIDGKFELRACIVNFRATLADVEALPEIVIRSGRQVDWELRKWAFSAA